MFFYFLAGRLPFKEPTDYLIFQKILKGEYTFPEGFDPAGRDLVEKLLVCPFPPNPDLAVHLMDAFLSSGQRPDTATDCTRHQRPPIFRSYHRLEGVVDDAAPRARGRVEQTTHARPERATTQHGLGELGRWRCGRRRRRDGRAAPGPCRAADGSRGGRRAGYEG